MKLSKFVVIVKLSNDKSIIHNTNKKKDVDEWLEITKDNNQDFAEILIYELNQGTPSYTQTYGESKRKVGFWISSGADPSGAFGQLDVLRLNCTIDTINIIWYN